MALTPFGEQPRKDRLRRALVYFGLKGDRPADGGPALPAAAGERPAAGRRALEYFGLASGRTSRYGPGVSAELDGDVDDLAARVAALERELRRRGGA
jgi:hypothetical protein